MMSAGFIANECSAVGASRVGGNEVDEVSGSWMCSEVGYTEVNGTHVDRNPRRRGEEGVDRSEATAAISAAARSAAERVRLE